MKKLLSLILVVIMLITTTFGGGVTAKAEEPFNAQLITTEQPVKVKYSETTDALVKFIPTESGTYKFETDIEYFSGMFYLYNASMITLSSQYEYLEVNLIGGETYYIGCHPNYCLFEYYNLTISKMVPATGVNLLEEDTFTGYVGQKTSFSYELLPSNAMWESVTWSSSDDSVVTVEKGFSAMEDFGSVTMHKVGTAVITVSLANGASDSCTITVKEPETITTEEPLEIRYADKRVLAKFIPAESGKYKFQTSYEAYDPYMELSDENMNYLYYGYSNLSCELQAGKTYYIYCSENYDHEDPNGSYYLSVEKQKILTNLEIISLPYKLEYIKGDVNAINYHGLILKATWSDGSTTDWEYGNGVFLGDYNINIYPSDNVNEDGIIYIDCADFNLSFELTLTENPIESIEVISDKVVFVENTEGYFSDYYDWETGEHIEYFHYFYYEEKFSDTLKIKINYTNGTSEIVDFIDEDYRYKFSTDDNQEEKPWSLGDDNYITISYYGRTDKIPVSIIENPVERIEITSMPTITEYIYGDDTYGQWWDDGFYRLDLDSTNLEITVYFNDGTTKTVSAADRNINGYVDGFSFEIDYEIFPDVCKTLPVNITYMGKTANFTVNVNESPIASIEVTKPLKKISQWYGPDFIGTEFTITYKDGTTKVVTITEDNVKYGYLFHSDDGWCELEIDGYIFQISERYSEDLGLHYYAKYKGAICDLTDYEYVDTREIDTVELENVTFNGNGMKIKITYTDGTSETLTAQYFQYHHFNPNFLDEYYMYAPYVRTEKGFLYCDIMPEYDDDYNPLSYEVYIFDQTIVVEAEAVKGDTNGDGNLNLKDLVTLSQYVAQWDVEVNESALDVNGDGSVNLNDVTLLSQYLAGWNVTLN